MGHSGPLSCFSNLSLFSRKFTVSHQSFTFPYPAYSFYSSFLASHFLPIYSLSLFHRYSQFTVFSQIFTVLYWHPASTLSISHSAPCLQDPHRSSSIFHRSSTYFRPLFSSLSPTWYLDSRSFRPTLQISKSFLFLPYPHGSSQIFHRSSKNFISSIPYYLVSGQSVIPAHSPVLQVPPFPP